MFIRCSALCSLLLASFTTFGQGSSATLGIFAGQDDLGTILHAGSAKYDAAHESYTVSGSGDNTWFKADDLHFVWKKVDGDVTLSSNIAFAGTTGNNHRKAMLMIRQSLSPDSAYVDVARHGDGLTSLQYRNATGDTTREIELNVSAPPKVRITKRGDFFFVSYAAADGQWQNSGAAMMLPLHAPFYVGLAVCSHDKDVSETAVFENVKLEMTSPKTDAATVLHSTLEVVPIASTDRRVVYTAAGHFEAPNWFHDSSGFLINQDGRLHKISANIVQTGPIVGSAPAALEISGATAINNDHGFSPDGARIAFSDSTQAGGSRIYMVPVAGGKPQQLTADAPSYWHGWSPDGQTLAFTAGRNGAAANDHNGDYDIYTIPATGGAEKRLTTAKGLDDGPEYSPDGQFIYFNSERTGHMQIWKMHADGSAQEQVTHDETNDWFPHISPDGKWMVFIAYQPGVTGHPANQEVTLQLMSMADGKITLLAKLFGGQGTINVPSWSPDSTRVAFVSYALIPAEDTKQ